MIQHRVWREYSREYWADHRIYFSDDFWDNLTYSFAMKYLVGRAPSIIPD